MAFQADLNYLLRNANRSRVNEWVKLSPFFKHSTEFCRNEILETLQEGKLWKLQEKLS